MTKIKWLNFFPCTRLKSRIAPANNKQAVADKIAVLLNSGGKSGVPRIKLHTQVKLRPTEALAKKNPEPSRPIKDIKAVSASVPRKEKIKT